MIRPAALALLMATSATAEQHLAELHAGILACDDLSCIGAAAQLCMEMTERGQSTAGMVDCMAQETAVWDDLLNATYGDVIAMMRAGDAADAETAPEYAVREDSLRAAQRAWITFRDANCRADHAVWGTGSMRRIAGASCMLQMTAERTLDLRDYLEMFP